MGAPSKTLLIHEDKEEEEKKVTKNFENEVAVGSDNKREWPAGTLLVSYLHPSKKQPAEISTSISKDFISPRQKDIMATTPMIISTISPNDANPLTAADTATARFG
jgi:hypothetical protein